MMLRGRVRLGFLSLAFLFMPIFANAAWDRPLRIKVLDSEIRSVAFDDNGVPINCEQITFDAYCRSSRTARLMNILLVQEDNGTQLRVTCTADSKFSRCTPLPVGDSYDAKLEKNGITIAYIDDKGKERKQLYTLVDPAEKKKSRRARVFAPFGSAPPATTTTATAATAPAVAAPSGASPAAAESAGWHQVAPAAAPAQTTVAPVSSQAPATAPAQGGLAQKTTGQATGPKVRCNFSSTPPGADITIDGSYVGNTPSEISLTTGKHVVMIAMVGFGEWKRELTVASDSVVNVTAALQPAQP